MDDVRRRVECLGQIVGGADVPERLRLGPVRLARLAYVTAGRVVGAAGVCCALVLVPCALAALAVLAQVDAVIVNGEVSVVDVPAGVAVGVGVVLTAAWLAVIAVCGAVCVLSAGVVLARPVPVGGAARTMVWRLPALGGVAVVAGMWVVAVAVLGAVIAAATVWWLAVLVVAVPVLASLRYVLAVPVVVLEGAGPVRAVRRAHQLTVGRAGDSAVVVFVAGILVPAGLVASVTWGLGVVVDRLGAPLSGWAAWAVVFGEQLVRAAGLVLGVTVFAAVVTLVYLGGRVPQAGRYEAEADPAVVAARLPTGVSSAVRVVAAAVAGVVVVPLAYVGLAAANPMGWPVVVDRQAPKGFGGARVSAVVLAADRVAGVATGRGWGLDLVACGPRSCSRTVELDHRAGLRAAAVAPLPGGRFVTVAWTERPVGSVNDQVDLVMFTCRPARCGREKGNGRVSVRQAHNATLMDAAVAVLPDGQVLVGSVSPDTANIDQNGLYLTTCPDHRCTTPRSVRLGPGDADRDPAGQSMSVAADHTGRIVIAQTARRRGAVTLTVCPDPACTRPVRSEHLVGEPARQLISHPAETEMQVQVAFLAGDRPVVAYRTPQGQVGLLRCTSSDCAQAARTELAPARARPDEQGGPSLAVDRAGRAVLALTSPATKRLTLLRCPDPTCTNPQRTLLEQARHGPGAIALTLNGRDRPRITWTGHRDGPLPRPRKGGAPMHITECADALCRPDAR